MQNHIIKYENKDQVFPFYNIYSNYQFLTEARWTEWSQQSDQHRQQLVVDLQQRDIILEFTNRTYNKTDFPSLIEDTDSNQIVSQFRGVIGLRILLSYPNLKITYRHIGLLNLRRISQFLGMAANQRQPQLQLESLRLFNNLTCHLTYQCEQICKMIAEAAGIRILTKLLYEGNLEILSRVILILGNICKCSLDLNSFIIKEGTIKLLVSVAESNSNIKIKLQCCWVLSIFSIAHFQMHIPHDYQLIASFLCKTMENIITLNPLFYLCCRTLRRPQAVTLIIEHKVYEKILAVNIQKDRYINQSCLLILSQVSYKIHNNQSIFIGIYDYISECLCISKQQWCLRLCHAIIRSRAGTTPQQIETIMKHQSLIPKMVQLLQSGKLIKHLQSQSIPWYFTNIFFNMTTNSKSKFKQFSDRLIDLGVIKTLVQIMKVNLSHNVIIYYAVEILLTLFQQKPSPQTTRLYILLQKLEIIKILQQMKSDSSNNLRSSNFRKLQNILMSPKD